MQAAEASSVLLVVTCAESPGAIARRVTIDLCDGIDASTASGPWPAIEKRPAVLNRRPAIGV